MVIPDDFSDQFGAFKIHDWTVMMGSFGAWILKQCKGLGAEQRTRMVEYLYACEHLTLKEVQADTVEDKQQDIIRAVARLYNILPLYVVAPIVQEQNQHWQKQVRHTHTHTHTHTRTHF